VVQRTWSDIRSLRAEPPEPASKGDRRRVFAAALEQAERLWSSSLSVGPAASPMLKFYALSQAGRAICAARAPKGNGWRPPESHGLTVEMKGNLFATSPLEAVEVSREGAGLVQLVAQTTGSPVIAAPVTLATLIGTTPLAFSACPDIDLEAEPILVDFNDGNWITTETSEVIVGPVPPTFITTKDVPESPTSTAHTMPVIRDPDEVREWLATYPSLAALGPPSEVRHINPMSYDRRPNPQFQVYLTWPKSALPNWQAERALVDWALTDPWSTSQRGLVLPPIGGNTEPISPLVGWWLILYALSMLSRYYPEHWVALLDVDKSSLATPLAMLLETEAEIVPELIYDALTNGPR